MTTIERVQKVIRKAEKETCSQVRIPVELLKEILYEADNGTWIPVSERLPKQEQIPFDCLVALKSGAVREATFLDVDPVHRWCTELHWFNTVDVIAWMPLPQPPTD